MFRRGNDVLVLLIVTILLMTLPSKTQAQQKVHVVQAGETLTSIAQRYGTTANALARNNGIVNPNLIYAGQRLVVDGGKAARKAQGFSTNNAGGTVYIVRSGDTLGSIAARHGTTAARIAAANGISNMNFIWVDQRLTIPVGNSGYSGAVQPVVKNQQGPSHQCLPELSHTGRGVLNLQAAAWLQLAGGQYLWLPSYVLAYIGPWHSGSVNLYIPREIRYSYSGICQGFTRTISWQGNRYLIGP